MSNVPYFKSVKISDGTWQIQYNYSDREHVYCYLIEGRDYALAIDTMNGYGNLRAYCETLTDKPIRLANTHAHPDHTNGNYDFDACYMHPADIKYFYDFPVGQPEKIFERCRAGAKEEYRGLMEVSDISVPRDMKVYPIYDGDTFDLGDRKVLVVDVSGHTPGSVVFIDTLTRICFSGDACNGNTLMDFGNALPIERYLKNLLHFRRFRDMFDVMYGGHQVLPPETIDEAIELCAKVIAGTDDKEPRKGLFGQDVLYAARHADNGFSRADGKNFNMSYNPDRIFDNGAAPQNITLAPANAI